MCRKMKAAFEPLEIRDSLDAGIYQWLGTSLASFYSIDGTGNNIAHPEWGSAGTELLRIAPAEYGDGISTPAGADRPSAREISNALADSGGQDVISERQLSAMIYAWGQFIDHDLDLTPTGSSEALPVSVPTGDPSFDPQGTGSQIIPLMRSVFDPDTGASSPREQINAITAWLDGSMIYGSDAQTAAALRTFSGGRLKMGPDGLLPLNDASNFADGTLAMANDAHRVSDDQLFAAGDVRANENIELTSLQTLFVREHNRLAGEIAKANPDLDDESIYQAARAFVIGELQVITYKEWLPTLLGSGAMKAYQGYNPNVNPGIANEFSTAAFRLGHSLLGDDVEFLDNRGRAVADGVPLSDAFFNPDLVEVNGVSSVLKYLSSDPSSELDLKVVDSVRNFLFGPPGAGGLDLASLNIQRGRDHGLADYNSIREAYGLARLTSFGQITADVHLQSQLQELYGDVDDVDAWVGMLAEDHVRGGSVGETLRAVVSDQFQRLRDGDRFWYQNVFSGKTLKTLEQTTLADVIRRNTDLTNLQKNVFVFKAEVSGRVFIDANRDGRLNKAERGLGGQPVELADATSGELIASTQTDAKGRYHFDVADGLRTGVYQVRLTPPEGIATAAAIVRTIAVTRGDQFAVGVDLGVVPPRKGPSAKPMILALLPKENHAPAESPGADRDESGGRSAPGSNQRPANSLPPAGAENSRRTPPANQGNRPGNRSGALSPSAVDMALALGTSDQTLSSIGR